jgi:hypothetical protein
LLAGLLLAGCAFDPGGSSAGSDADASQPGADARPGADSAPGTPDATPVPPDAAAVEPVLLETLTIEAQNTDPIQSSVVLVVGQTYRLVASGVVAVRTDGWSADADYYWDDRFPGVPGDSAGGVDYGLAVNDTGGSSSRSPDWGEYTQTHVYEAVIPGNDKFLSAVFYDFDNSNDSGSLTLEIWGPP